MAQYAGPYERYKMMYTVDTTGKFKGKYERKRFHQFKFSVVQILTLLNWT